ncbi:MAG: glycosyltransferase family 4 protein [Nitrososphaerota archaeon]|nr:glycosyltransferase family 4 protein [Nitrososphaerota archaeon]MDG7021759.1 glycosyltransferase family 4 protein [Nitrososphaerota archaeon]
MRVAILTRDYPPTVGGIATHVQGLVGALRRMGVEADLYVGRNDVKTLLLPFDIPLRGYDLVHVQSLPYGAFVFGVPLVVTVHSPVLEEFPHYRAALKALSMPAIALEKASLSRASAVLAVSAQSRSDLVRSYGLREEEVGVIGNGVDYGRFSSGPGAAAAPDGKVLVVSRLEPRKNVQEAIEAVAELPKGSCTLEVAGDGSERSQLEHLARSLGAGDAVRFLGRVSEESLPDLYGGASVFLTTSASEGFGLSLLEAMSSGRACLASDLPTHRSLIENGVSGLIYRGHDELVSRLKELLSSPGEAARLGEVAREVARGLTWEKVAARVADAYEAVLRGRGRPRAGP